MDVEWRGAQGILSFDWSKTWYCPCEFNFDWKVFQYFSLILNYKKNPYFFLFVLQKILVPSGAVSMAPWSKGDFAIETSDWKIETSDWNRNIQLSNINNKEKVYIYFSNLEHWKRVMKLRLKYYSFEWIECKMSI